VLFGCSHQQIRSKSIQLHGSPALYTISSTKVNPSAPWRSAAFTPPSAHTVNPSSYMEKCCLTLSAANTVNPSSYMEACCLDTTSSPVKQIYPALRRSAAFTPPEHHALTSTSATDASIAARASACSCREVSSPASILLWPIWRCKTPHQSC
jgi:hypothetical protein